MVLLLLVIHLLLYLLLFHFAHFLHEVGIVSEDVGHVPGQFVYLLRLLLLSVVDLNGLAIEVPMPLTLF